ncbi:MAG TPA: LolA-related protein [Stellaceae bacterium]|nr:LolA-related protein [Stellaceae bacterium]
MMRVLTLLALLAGGVPALAAAPDGGHLDLQQLMQRLSEVRRSTAYFSEHKELAMLNEPLDSSGTLAYVAPDKLEKDTLLPKPERITVDGDKLTLSQSGDPGSRTVSLRDQPELGAFVESIRATLAGDLPALQRYYNVTLQGSLLAWQMTLEPKERRLREMVKWIRISGRDASIRSIDSEEADGDRSEMTIVETGR